MVSKAELDAINAELQLPVDPVSGAEGQKLQAGAAALEAAPPAPVMPVMPEVQVAQAEPAVDYGSALDAALAAPELEPAAPAPDAGPDYGPMLDAALAAPEPEAPVDESTALGRGVETGLRQIQAAVPQMRGVAASFAGDAEGQAAAAADAAKILALAPQSKTPDFTYVNDMDSLLTYLGESVGQSAPQLLATMLGGGLVGLGSRAALSRVVTDPKVVAKVSGLAGGVGGAGINLPLEAGGSGQEFYQKTGDFEWKNALAVGAVNSALEWVVPSYLLRSVKNKAGSVLGVTAETGLLGGATEGVQELNQVLHLAALDAEGDYWSKETAIRVADAALRGAIGEGAIGGAAKAGAKALGIESTSDDDEASWGDVLTYMRQRYARKPEVVTDDVLSPGDYGADFTEASKMFAGVRRAYDQLGIRQTNAARVADFEDAQTPRFVYRLPDGKLSDVLTDTDLEAELATQPQGAQPEIYRVDLRSMNPAGVTADVLDLPASANDSRIFFSPSVGKAKQAELLQRYEALGSKVEASQIARLGTAQEKAGVKQALMPEYEQLVSEGLRVIPSRGSSFTFKGQVVGEKVDSPLTTGRTRATVRVPVGAVDPDLMQFKTTYEYTTSQPEANYRVVAVDSNRINFEDVMTRRQTGRPIDESMLWFKPGLSQAEQAALAAEYLAEMQQASPVLVPLRRKGVQVHPKFADLIYAQDANFKRKATRGVVTPGESMLGAPHSKSIADRRAGFRAKWLAKTGIGFRDGTTGYSPYALQWAALKSFAADLHRNLAVLSAKLGLPAPAHLIVVDDYSGGASADSASGEIQLGLKQLFEPFVTWRTPLVRGDLDQMRARLLQLVMHEWGHLVTNWNFQLLPAMQQQRLFAAYERARMDFSLRGTTAKTEYYVDPSAAPVQPAYSLTFEEWLAEQVRRASFGRLLFDISGRFYESVSQGHKQLAEAWAQHFPPDQVRDLLEPSWEMTQTLEYLEAAAAASQQTFEGKKAGISPGLSLSARQRLVESMPEYGETVALVNEWRAALPPETEVVLMPGVRGPEGEAGHFISNDPLTGKDTIRLWVGALERRGSQNPVAHEATHAVWHLLTPGERRTLVAAGRAAKSMSDAQARAAFQAYKAAYKKFDFNEQEAVRAARWEVDQEYAAHLIGQRFNGRDFASTNRLLDSLIELFSKVKALLLGRGWHSTESLAVAIKKGEVARRKQAEAQPRRRLPISRRVVIDRQRIAFSLYDDEPVFVRPGPMPGVAVIEQTYNEGMDGTPENRNYYFVKWTKPIPRRQDPMEVANIVASEGQVFATLELNLQGSKGYEVSWTNILDEYGYRQSGVPYMDAFYDWVFKGQLKQEARPSGHLMHDGYRMWQRRDPVSVTWHQPDPRTLRPDGSVNPNGTEWFSPNRIRAHYELAASNVQAEAEARKVPRNRARSYPEMVKWKQMLDKVPASYWSDPISLKAFVADPARVAAQREIELGEAQRGLERFDARVEQAVSGEPQARARSDYDEVAAEALAQSEAKALEPLVARMALNRWGENNPAVRRELSGIYTDMDKVSWFSRLFMSLKQLAWRNQHIGQLNEYTAFVDEMSAFRMAWIQRASETAKAWDKLSPAGWTSRMVEEQKSRLNDMLFWATEMRYLPAGQAARYPTPAELTAYMQANRILPETFALYQRIEGDFQAYLTEVERVMAENIRARNLTQAPNGALVLSPAGQAALAKLAADMQAMRKRPYFPMVRFGEWTITVRDPALQGRVVHFEAFPSERERDAAVRRLRQRYPTENFQVGRIQPDVAEFQGLPKPILEALLAEARTPGSPFQLTPQQIDWLESFSEQMAPEQSFKKRWLKRSGTPGYSLDAMRAYASYFNSGASYLARMAYAPKLSQEIASLRGTLKLVADTRKRGQIVQMVEEHFRYLMAPAKDWVKFRAAVTLWQLGFSPAAAFINLTQTAAFTLPYLDGIYGKRAYGLMANVAKGLKRPSNDPQFEVARQLLVQMGKLETGAAPELAAYAQGGNLIGMRAGTRAQQSFRSLARTSMWMFEQAERLNREIAFRLSWQLSDDPSHAHLQQVEQNFFHEITRLTTAQIQVGGQTLTPTWDTAVRIVAAREAIARTQFEYGREYRAKFMRNPLAGSFLVFFAYTQSALYAFGNNPGAVKLFLTYALLFGAMGLPGAEDLDELLKAVSRKLFGKDFSIEEEARVLVRDLTLGTPFEETGVDLFLHGISRYSFGPGLLQEGYGIPQFDASANGSMGQVIPGLAETARAVGRGDDWKSVTAELARDVAGAGFGQLFPMLQALSSDFPSADWKKWEAIMPRAVKAMSKAFRYGVEGEEHDRAGGQVAAFDVSDPDDLATIVAQGFGFTPTEVRQRYDLVGAQLDKSAFYTNSRTALMTQFYSAAQRKDSEARAEVIKRIREFNREMSSQGLGAMGITADSLRQSYQRRVEALRAREAGLPRQKAQTPLYRQVERLFPDQPEKPKPVK